MGDIYLDLTVKRLKRLNQYKKSLEDYENMREDLITTGSIDFTREKVSETYKIISSTEENAIKLYKVNAIIKSLKNKINTVEGNLNKLCEIDRSFLALRYIECWRIKNIAKLYNYSYDHTRKIMRKALFRLRDEVFNNLIYKH